MNKNMGEITEKKENNAWLIIIIIVLLLIILGLIAYVLYDNNNKNNNNKDDQIVEIEDKELNEAGKKEISYTYSNLEGEYTFKTNATKDADGNEEYDEFILELYSNGMFHYHITRYAEGGYIGNYIINDDKIELSGWFEHGSDAALTTNVKFKKTLQINSEKLIIDNDPRPQGISENEVSSVKKAELNKTNNNVSIERLYNCLENYGIYNNEIRKG